VTYDVHVPRGDGGYRVLEAGVTAQRLEDLKSAYGAERFATFLVTPLGVPELEPEDVVRDAVAANPALVLKE